MKKRAPFFLIIVLIAANIILLMMLFQRNAAIASLEKQLSLPAGDNRLMQMLPKILREYHAMKKASEALPEECKERFKKLFGKFMEELKQGGGQNSEIIPLPEENK